MAKDCILTIKDEVNIRFEGLDVNTRRKLSDAMQYFIPHAVYSPAYKLGRWDGTISYCDIGGRSYINLLDKLIPIVMENGYEITVDDQRETFNFQFDEIDEDSYKSHKWPTGHPMEGEPIVPRAHQIEIINSLLTNLQSVAIAATGAGKTLITAILSHKVEKYGRSIVIVPSKDLVTQTEEDYINMGLDVGVYFGDRKELGKTHTICTWQSLEALMRSDDKEVIESIQKDLVCVMCDETHKAKADCLRKLLTGMFANVPIRWGMTGTLPEEDYEKVVIQAVIGEVVTTVDAKHLQDVGVLSNLHIHVKQLHDAGQWDNYQSELSYLTTNPPRIKYFSGMIEEISQSGNTLILVDRIKTGEMLAEYLPDAVFLDGRVKSKDRKVEYDEVKEVDGKVIIATYGIASTGLNINRIYNLILFEAGKSFVRVIQSIGRGLRKAVDKDHVDVYDVTSSAKFSKRHLTKRKKFYKEQQYPFKVEKIKW